MNNFIELYQTDRGIRLINRVVDFVPSMNEHDAQRVDIVPLWNELLMDLLAAAGFQSMDYLREYPTNFRHSLARFADPYIGASTPEEGLRLLSNSVGSVHISNDLVGCNYAVDNNARIVIYRKKPEQDEQLFTGAAVIREHYARPVWLKFQARIQAALKKVEAIRPAPSSRPTLVPVLNDVVIPVMDLGEAQPARNLLHDLGARLLAREFIHKAHPHGPYAAFKTPQPMVQEPEPVVTPVRVAPVADIAQRSTTPVEIPEFQKLMTGTQSRYGQSGVGIPVLRNQGGFDGSAR